MAQRPNPFAPLGKDASRCYCFSQCGGPDGNGKAKHYSTIMKHAGIGTDNDEDVQMSDAPFREPPARRNSTSATVRENNLNIV
jgi:hypothetical protein